MDWKKYTPNGCRWTKPFSTGSGTCVVEFQLWYKWDNPDKSKRTIKFYTKLVLAEYAYYLQISAAGATRSNQQTGYTMNIGLNGANKVNAKSSINQPSSWGQASTGWHYEDLCSITKVLSYADNGTVKANIDYDLYMKWYSINQGSIKSIDSKGTYKVTDIPTIDTTSITSITLSSNSITNEIAPSHVKYTNIANTSVPQKVNAGQSITLKAVTDAYTNKERTVNFTVKPTTAKGNLTITTSNSAVASPKASTIDVSKTKSFILDLKKPGKTKITVKSDSNKTASLDCTVTSKDTIAWSSSNTVIATVNNGVVQAKNGVNGYTVISAFPVGNTTASNKVQTNVLLPPNNISISSNKDYVYPGETIGYTVTVEPFSSTNNAVRVASDYVGTKWEVDAITRGHAADGVLNNGATKSSNQYNVNYSFNNFVLPTDYVCLKVNSTYNTALTKELNTPVKAPTLDVDKTSIQVNKGGKGRTVTISTMPESSNSAFTYTYNRNYINVSKDKNVLTITGVNDSEGTDIVITGMMPILPTMSKPSKTVTVKVGSAPITSLSTTSTLNTDLGIANLAFTQMDIPLQDYYSPEVVNDYGWNGYDNSRYQINTIIETKAKEYTFDIRYAPNNASDTIYVSSSNESIVSIPNSFKEIYTGNGTGNGTIQGKLVCHKAGNATITLKNEDNTISTTMLVRCTVNGNLLLSSDKSSIVSINNTVQTTSNSGLGKGYLGITNEYNGIANLTVQSVVDRSKKQTLPFYCWLRPTSLELTSDKSNVFIGDTINLGMILKPYNANNSMISTALELSLVTYTYKTDKGFVFKEETSNRTLTRNWTYTIPDLEQFKGCKYFIISAVSSVSGRVVSDELKISFNQEGVSLDGTQNDRNLYLANTNNSYKDYNISVTPSTSTVDLSNFTEKDGFKATFTNWPKITPLRVEGTEYRNLTKNGVEATKYDTAFPPNNPNVSNVKGKTLTVYYVGPITTGGTTEIDVNVFTCEYFGYPKVINATKIQATSNSYNLKYYGDKPKLVFQLPTNNDFTILDDIIIKMSDNTTYSFKQNSNCFSASYSSNKHEHDILTSAIVDYTYPKNSDNGIAYMTFVPTNEVSNGNVTITYKSKFDTIPDAYINVNLSKQTLPELPKVGSLIKLDEVKSLLKIVENVLQPYYNGDNKLFDKKSSVELIYGVTNSIINSLGKIGEPISSMPFFKILFAMYATMSRLHDAISVIDVPGKIPISLDYIKPRLMLTTDTTRYDWYETNVERLKKTVDIALDNDYSNLFDGKHLGTQHITGENYPIMVDDSNDYVGIPELKIPNEYKDTNLYDEYTISPVAEIIKALQQF